MLTTVAAGTIRDGRECDADPAAFDTLAQAVSLMAELLAKQQISAIHVVKANRITGDARVAKQKLKKALMEKRNASPNGPVQRQVFADLESRLQTTIGDKLTGVMNRRRV